jgi:hypothetical protein
MFRAWNPWRDLVYDGATLSLFGFVSVIFNEASRLELDGLNVNRDALFREALHSLDKALNPPIKVTQAVLEAMANNIGAKFKRRGESWFPQDGYDTCSIGWNGDSKRFEYASNFPLQIGDRIQADDCPLALQVLLGFTTEGVPKDD